jgi:hypothetical protein
VGGALALDVLTPSQMMSIGCSRTITSAAVLEMIDQPS